MCVTDSSPTIPALFWNNATGFDKALTTLAAHMYCDPSSPFRDRVYKHTSELRRHLHCLGAFVGWLPILHGLRASKQDAAEFRAAYKDRWAGLDAELSFHYPAWWLEESAVAEPPLTSFPVLAAWHEDERTGDSDDDVLEEPLRTLHRRRAVSNFRCSLSSVQQVHTTTRLLRRSAVNLNLAKAAAETPAGKHTKSLAFRGLVADNERWKQVPPPSLRRMPSVLTRVDEGASDEYKVGALLDEDTWDSYPQSVTSLSRRNSRASLRGKASMKRSNEAGLPMPTFDGPRGKHSTQSLAVAGRMNKSGTAVANPQAATLAPTLPRRSRLPSSFGYRYAPDTANTWSGTANEQDLSLHVPSVTRTGSNASLKRDYGAIGDKLTVPQPQVWSDEDDEDDGKSGSGEERYSPPRPSHPTPSAMRRAGVRALLAETGEPPLPLFPGRYVRA